jgi:hypothetical protein
MIPIRNDFPRACGNHDFRPLVVEDGGPPRSNAMSQTMSYQDTNFAPAVYPAHVMRRANRRKPARVPSLNWPTDLFRDDVTQAECMAEDFSPHAAILTHAGTTH